MVEVERVLDELFDAIVDGRSVAVYPDGRVERYSGEVEIEMFVRVGGGRRRCVGSGLSLLEVMEMYEKWRDDILDPVLDRLPEWVRERWEEGAKVTVSFSAVTEAGPVAVFYPVNMRTPIYELILKAAFGRLLLGFGCPGPNADVVGINIQVREIPDECLRRGADMLLRDTLKRELAYVVRPTHYQRERLEHSSDLELPVRDTIGVRGIRWFFSAPEGPPDP